MKKSMLCAGLLVALGAGDALAAQADVNTTPNNAGNANNQATTPAQQTPQTVLPLSATQGTNAPASVHTTPGPVGNGNTNPANPTTTTPAPGTTTTPTQPSTTTVPAGQNPTAPQTTTTPATQTQPVTTIPTNNATTPVAAQAMDCNFKIPATTTTVDQSVVLKWAQNAAEQSFEFDFNSIDNQLGILKTCFTDQGWQGFNDALQKSGNLNAIKTEKLMVSSMVDGTATIAVIKDNQWRVIVPLQVVYQNDKEKLTQPLSVSLVVGRKVSGDLGIMQMIATPRPSTSSTAPTTTTTTNTAPPATTNPTNTMPQ